MIFQWFQYGREYKEATRDPAGYAQRKADAAIRTITWIWNGALVVVGVPLFIFGFTNVWGGPYRLVQVIWVIWCVIAVIAFVIMRFVARAIRRNTKVFTQRIVDQIQQTREE